MPECSIIISELDRQRTIYLYIVYRPVETGVMLLAFKNALAFLPRRARRVSAFRHMLIGGMR